MKKTVRALLGLVLALTLCAGLLAPSALAAAAPALSNFTGASVYTPGQFTDVNEAAWYGSRQQGVVRTVCELGLMEGFGGGEFRPAASLTVAQAVALAVRINDIYNGGTGKFTQGDPWYDVYFQYAQQSGMLWPDDFADGRDLPATRSQMAYIFSKALPAAELTAINSVTSLPDVDSSTPYSDSIFELYNAGVLTGSDDYGSFQPYALIDRAAAAAIAARLVRPAQRQTLSLKARPASLLTGYTDQQVLNYFEKTAYYGEYDGFRDAALRWNTPVICAVHGDPSAEDLATVQRLFDVLNTIAGFPGIILASGGGSGNMNLYFVSEKRFGDYASIPDSNVWGFANCNYMLNDYAITNTIVLIADEIPTRLERDSILSEEIIQSLGLLNDSFDYPESVFYQDSNSQGWPASIDWALVRILYNADMPQGASHTAGMAAAKAIIAKLEARA